MSNKVLYVTIPSPLEYYSGPYDKCVMFFQESEAGKQLARFTHKIKILVTNRTSMEVRVHLSPELSDEDRIEAILRFGGGKQSDTARRYYGDYED
jgi:pyruvate-formate lyase-activating enzyme